MLQSVSAFIRSTGLGIALFLEREAGYHAVSLVLIVAGVAMADPTKRAELARDLVVFGLGILSRSMGAAQKDKTP